MIQSKVVITVSIVALLLLAACGVPPKAPNATGFEDDDLGPLPDIDDVGITEGIDDAADVLAGDDGVAPKEDPKEKPKVQPKADSKAVPKDAIRKEVTEGQKVSFPNLKASDPDGDKVKFTFSEPLDSNGEWQTKPGDAGEYVATVTASDGKNTVTQKVLIVVKSANRAPAISGPTEVRVQEGGTVSLNQKVTDPDGDKVTVSYTGWMTGPSKKTNFNDAGTHKVIVKATDGKLSTQREVAVKVKDVNRRPVISPIAPISVTEGEKVVVIPKATDPDGDKASFVFEKPLDDSGSWKTKVGDAGAYNIKVTVSDGQFEDSENVVIAVKKLNQAPEIANFKDVKVDEGKTVVLTPKISDPDGDKVTAVYSGWMTTGTKKTSFEDSGKHEVSLTVTDTAGNTVKKTITVSIRDVNRPPVFDPDAFS